MGKVATYPLLPRGSPPLQSGGQNQKWPTCGQGGYVTPAASGIPSASERGAESEVAHLWARWPLNPCRLGDPLRFRAGDRAWKALVTSPSHPFGSPRLCRVFGVGEEELGEGEGFFLSVDFGSQKAPMAMSLKSFWF